MEKLIDCCIQGNLDMFRTVFAERPEDISIAGNLIYSLV